MDNRNENEGNSDFVRDLLGFMIMCGVILGPALLVAWLIFQLALGILF
jgi:hypothetical protein